MTGALDGLTVIDLTSHVSGPYCTMMLADMGADVIKVERPEGDDARRMTPQVSGESAPFMQINRNKRSVVLDLKLSDDLAALKALIRTADVFVENFKPGTAGRLGLGYDDLCKDNPRLIYCSISGFGQTGPLKDRGGFDLMVQAMCGLMSVCGDPDGPPHRLPPPISDIGCGMFAAFGVACALTARHRIGRGQHIDTSLYEAGLSFSLYEAASFFATGEPPERLGQAHRGAAPYQVFQTADGWLTIGGAGQIMWQRICQALDLPELEHDPRFHDNAARVANRTELVAILQQRLTSRRTAEWENVLEQAGVPMGPVQSYDQVLTDPHTLARRMVVDVMHPTAGAGRLLGPPVKLSATPASVRRPAPLLGEHTREVLAQVQEPGKSHK